MYPPELTIPMKKELTDRGFNSLQTAEEVDNVMKEQSGTTLMVVNSVCGCAAAGARPGVLMAVHEGKRPDRLVTVFAGVDRDAVDKAREYFLPYPPSSPCVALFKDGKLVHFLERHNIEGRPAQMIAANLKMAIEQYC